MKKYNLLVLAVLLAAVFSTQALAAPPLPGTQLTPDQIAKIKADRQANRTAMGTQRAQTTALTDQLKIELKKKPVDSVKVKSLMDQISSQRDAMQIRQMEAMSQRQGLKPADRTRYNDILKKMKDRQAKRQQPAQ
jgi:hypothetical protein